MDRNTIIGFVLIGIVLMVWMSLNAPPPQKPQDGTDSAVVKKERVDTAAIRPEVDQKRRISADTLGKFFSHLAKGENKKIVIETPRYRAEIGTEGGSIQSWVLTQFKTWDGHPVNLINGDSAREFNLLFVTSDGKFINTKDLIFQSGYQGKQILRVEEGESLKVELTLNINGSSRIIKSLIFYGSSYSFDATYRFEGMENVISNYEYQITWEGGLRYAERNSINESNFAKASGLAGGELFEVDATNFTDVVKQNISGRVVWISCRNKYFAAAIIPREKESQGAYLEGIRLKMPDNGAVENYSFGLKVPFSGHTIETDRYTVFLGPLDFDIVKKYNVELERTMSLGAAWIIRPISEYVIIPLFKFLHSFIWNYGLVLIFFSIIVKVVLYPLTKTSMSSMRKMQALQPMMNEIREKYKGDPQKMNAQIMRLYKEYGVNPAGGCLPMLLQLPILYALWAVFSSTIELRQASFLGWIHDLSIPDVVTRLPFKIPIFGIDELSGLALLMGITMFVQQKMSVQDPRQKMMVWLMPVLLTLMFNGFPSGLNLYYFMFNLLSIVQQVWFNKKHKNDPLRKVEEKKNSGGILNRLSKNLPKTTK